MQSTCSPRCCAILATAVLTCLLALPLTAAAQQNPPAPNPPFITPQLDPPIPPGAADDIAARMAARRAAQAAQTNPAGASIPTNAGFSPPPAIVPAPQPAPPNTMIINYENATVDAILNDMSRAFGFIVVKSFTIPQRVTIQVPNPVNADEALDLLNAVLFPLGYGTLATKTDAGPQTKTIVRIASIQEVKKAQIPVMQGADPDKIPVNDTLITQIIPLKNVNAVRLRMDLMPMLSADADVTANAESNCIIITDTSAKIHRIVSLMATLDKVAADRPSPPPAPAGRGGITRPSDVPFIMSAVIDGGAFQIRHGDILGEVQAPKATLTAPAAPPAGILAKINVHEGQAVKAGDILFEFDARAAQADLKAAEAHLLALRNQILPPGAPRADIDRNQADIAAADAAVARDRFVLDSLQIRAPIPGTLTSFDFTPGQYLPAGTPLTQIIDTQPEDLTLSFRLAFNDRTRLKIGQKITFTVSDKLPPYPAEITFISPTADDSNRTEIRARLTLSPAASATPLIPGVLGTITIPDL